MPWTLNLWGKTELRDVRGEVVQLTTRHQLLILAILAHSRAGCTRKSLASQVWPLAAERALPRLRSALPDIRKELPGLISVVDEGFALDAKLLELIGDREAPFMPEFDEDWVIDRRLEYRDAAVQGVLDKARSAGTVAEALAFAKRAVEIDPYDAEAAALHWLYLEKSGEAAQAIEHRDRYRARVIRELGILPGNPVAVAPTASPLLAATEWLSEREPEEAAALLASTESQWMLMRLDEALAIHRKVATRLHPDSRFKLQIDASTAYLETMAGQFTRALTEIGAMYESARAGGQLSVAMRLANLLGYSNLSRGEFRRSVHFGHRYVETANAMGDPRLIGEALLHLAIFQEHSGFNDASRRSLDECDPYVERAESATLHAMYGHALGGAYLREGRFDLAADYLAKSRRIFETNGHARMDVWIAYSEANLAACFGSWSEALAGIRRVQAVSPASGGHSVVALTAELEGAVFCKLGEYDQAADALARAQVFRRQVGSVASMAERRKASVAKRIIRQRLSQADLRKALRRAEQTDF